MASFAPQYARAFADAVAESNLDATAVRQQLEDLASSIAGSHDLRETLANPSIPHEQKLKVLDALCGRIGCVKQVRNFLAVLMDHNRLDGLQEVLAEYNTLADSQQKIAEVDVTSAHALNQEDRKALEEKLAKVAGAKVRATYHEDGSLLGGAVVKIGCTVYDGSVRGQLNRLKRELVNA